jgi:thiol-disulfide isomerase/thioredoxin
MRHQLERLRASHITSALLGLCLLSLFGSGPLAADAIPPAPQIDRLPELSIVTLDGRKLTNADLQGKVVLFDFWATWCVPCVQATPKLKSIAKSFAGDPRFMILGISVDDNGAALRQFLEKEQVPWPQYWDEKKLLTMSTFKITTFPTYLVVDPEGRVVYQSRGWSEQGMQTLEDNVQKAVRAAKSGKPEPAR